VIAACPPEPAQCGGSRTRSKDAVDETGNRVDHVLAVVHDQQEALVPQEPNERVREWAIRDFAQPNRRRDGVGHTAKVGDRGHSTSHVPSS
jgi:hypothetical protein